MVRGCRRGCAALIVAVLLALGPGTSTSRAAPPASPTPGPSAAPTPRETADPPQGPAAQRPATTPARDRLRARAGDDLELGGSVSSTCSTPTKLGTLTGSIWIISGPTTSNLHIPWRLTGSDGSVQDGVAVPVVVDPEYPEYPEVSVSITDITVGVSYTFAVYADGADPDSATPADTSLASALRCIEATTTCDTVTFTNPAGNPRAALRWTHGPDDPGDDAPYFHDTLDPGDTVSHRTAYEVVHWTAGPADEDEDDPLAGSSGLGDADVKVAHACNPPSLQVISRCQSDHRDGSLVVDVDHLPTEKIRTEVSRMDRPYRDWSKRWNRNGRTTDRWILSVPRPGEHFVSVFVSPDLDDDFEYAVTHVARCVQTTVTDTEVTFTNPKGNLPVKITYGPVGPARPQPVAARSTVGDEPQTVRVQPSHTVRRPWDGRTLRWSARQIDRNPSGVPVELRAGGGDVQPAQVRETPTPAPRPTAEPHQGSDVGQDDSGSLADTGGAGAGLLIVGLVLSVTGLRLTGARRSIGSSRSSRS